MIQMYFGRELTEFDLRESCKFTNRDIETEKESEIDFILVADQELKELSDLLPPYMVMHLQNRYIQHDTYFRGEPKSVFIFWHD